MVVDPLGMCHAFRAAINNDLAVRAIRQCYPSINLGEFSDLLRSFLLREDDLNDDLSTLWKITGRTSEVSGRIHTKFFNFF